MIKKDKLNKNTINLRSLLQDFKNDIRNSIEITLERKNEITKLNQLVLEQKKSLSLYLIEIQDQEILNKISLINEKVSIILKEYEKFNNSSSSFINNDVSFSIDKKNLVFENNESRIESSNNNSFENGNSFIDSSFNESDISLIEKKEKKSVNIDDVENDVKIKFKAPTGLIFFKFIEKNVNDFVIDDEFDLDNIVLDLNTDNIPETVEKMPWEEEN
jgi:hypothetical protein